MTENPSPERRKADQLREKADRLNAEFERRAERNKELYGRFAGGQPLLSGHHSYRSARRDKNRADAHFDRTIDVYKEAEKAKSAAKWAKAKADAQEAITSVTSTRARPWQPRLTALPVLSFPRSDSPANGFRAILRVVHPAASMV